ncbi:hypothetical protein JYT78_00845 [bacterium AH-315-I20]|nr:hypothetical protein [bacterium AH-315-I20]
MKKIILSAASLAVAAVASVSVVPTNAEAVPAFARQTGAACLNCHFQVIPRLAAMGREFRANGMVDASIDLIEDDHLSLPATFGASVLFKARMGTNDNNNNWDSGNSSAFQYPDEAALLMGGRLGEHTGALAEWAGGPLSYKVVQMFEAGDAMVGVVLASTDALGTAYAFNNPSNALVRNIRGSQFRPGFLRNSSVQQGVTGYGAYYSSDMIHVGVAQFINNFEFNPSGPAGNAAMQLGQGLISFDLAWIGDVAGFDTVASLYSITGTQKHKAESTIAGEAGTNANGAVEEYSETTTGVALQMQGEVGDTLAGLYVVVQVAGEQKDNTGAVTADLTGFNLLGTYSINPSSLVKVGYSSTTDAAGATDVTNDTIVIGAIYDLVQNFSLDLEYASTTGDSPDNSSTTLLFEYVF